MNYQALFLTKKYSDFIETLFENNFSFQVDIAKYLG